MAGYYIEPGVTTPQFSSSSPWNETTSSFVDDVSGSSCGNPSGPFCIPQTTMSTPIYGFVSPPVILFTVITNTLICAVLLRRNMRTATNGLLLAMAVADMMTGLWPLPCYVYFYTLGAVRYYVPYGWCVVYSALTDVLPTVFHTASIWLTVALALHRYVCVCHPQAAKSWCTVSNVVKIIIGIYFASCLSHVTKFFEWSFEPVEVSSQVIGEDNEDSPINITTTNATMIGCRRTHPALFVAENFMFLRVYYWFRVIFIHLVPCSVLVVFNALLLITMQQAQRRRRQLLAQNRRTESRRLAESNLTTTMLIAVVGVFLLVEFPLAILLIVFIVLDDHHDSWAIATLLVNTFILLSYPINFFIYCGMSQQFRETFTGMFGLSAGGGGKTHATTTAVVEMTTIEPCHRNTTGNRTGGIVRRGSNDEGGKKVQAKRREVSAEVGTVDEGRSGNAISKVRYMAVGNGTNADGDIVELVAGQHSDEVEQSINGVKGVNEAILVAME